MMNTDTAPTKSDLKAGAAIVFSVAETIRELGSTPAGPLYAALMTKGVDMQGFDGILRILRNADLVERRGDMLVWIGPMLAERRSIMDEQRRAEKEGRP